MSGFAGIVRFDAGLDTAETDRLAIARMAQAIAFRGPDAQRQFISDGAAFAFSLLTTGPAPQAPAQPVTLDGRAFFLGDVRLDRRAELIERLTQQGEPCDPSATDEEIVLRAWRLYRNAGISDVFLEELHGDYSFALWEPARRELHCFRDLMGGKPFYYCSSANTFAFSNTLRAIHHAPGFKDELDGEYIGDFLLVSWCPRPSHTVYRSIRKLTAGHWLTFSRHGLEVKRFQQLPIEEPLFLKREEEYVEIYRDLLERAVADRLPNTSSAIFMSGGIDSPSVAAAICGLRKKTGRENNLFAVTADLKPCLEDDEGNWACRVAAHLGIRHHWSHHGDRPPFSDYAPFDFPEPLANPYWATHLHLCTLAAKHSRVAFMGYGGDNVLNDETWPYLRYLFGHGQWFRALSSFIGYSLTKKRFPPLRAGLRTQFRRCLRLDSKPPYPRWIAAAFERDYALRHRWQELIREPERVHPVHAIGYRTLTNFYWPAAFEVEDAAYVGLPLEKRSPLFDFRLLRFLLRLPALPWCVEKELPRRALKGRLPPEALTRPKSPVSGDILLAHARAGLWQPRTHPIAKGINLFVQWQRFLQESARPYGESGIGPWDCVAPVALNLWLNQIEKG